MLLFNDLCKIKIYYKVVELVGGGSVISGATLSSFNILNERDICEPERDICELEKGYL